MWLTEARAGQWTLIGAQMVALHGWAHSTDPPRRSADADILVNIRLAGVSVETIAEQLLERGYEMHPPSAWGIAHRFKRGAIVLDVLAPENVGQHAEAKKRTIPPFRTVEVPGGTQALRRTEMQPIASRDLHGRVPLPSLLAAILGKTRALELADTRPAHSQDLAFLLTLGAELLDVEQARADLAGGEAGWLRRHPEFADHTTAVWRGHPNQEDGATFFRRLSGLPPPELEFG